jgi:nucleotide sugar dehydrogenase
MNISVVGLGKIGLPIALQYTTRGHTVIGADIDPHVVARIEARAVAEDEEPGTSERLAAALDDGRFSATKDTAAAVAASEFVVLAVPLVVDADARPDHGIIDAATEDVARGLTPGTTVIYETTLPVGTTRTRLAPALAAGSGLTLGQDLFVCHSPERVFTGRVYEDLRRYPKLVGGVDEASAARAVEFYTAVLEFDERPDLDRPNGVWDLGSSDAAELAKLAETTYRDVNIALANQFATHADDLGVDVGLVISAANSQPYSHIHQPGIAVGGHCIPVYPRLYLSTDPDAVLVASARARNEAMPAYAVARLEDQVGPLAGREIVVLGAAYRGGVKETAFSGVFATVRELERRGARARVHDPLYRDDELVALGFVPHTLGDRCEVAIVQADHAVYRGLGPGDLPGVEVVLDGRDSLDPAPWVDAGIPVLRIGRPDVRPT